MAQRTCASCASDISHTHANQRYCSPVCRDAKKWADRPRLACSVCGGPTGWTATGRSLERVDPTAVRCRPCTRGPNYRPSRNKRADGYVDRWTCAECGVDCERPATKGQRPKYCDTCRRTRRNPLIRLAHKVRLAIYERDGWECGLCSGSVDRDLIGTRSHWRPSLDHVVPRSAGGADDPSNLRLAHWWCNSVRGAGVNDALFEEAS